jgi:pimeloyl-ACP methyl ester carboxylesterase
VNLPTVVAAEVDEDVEPVVLHAGQVELSGLLAVPESPPRALVLALHGGGMTAGYFHGRAHPDLSLLRLGRDLGFSVLALDRPGYGRSRAFLPDGQSLTDQASTVFDALQACAATADVGAGVFVVGHSYGLKLALHLAAHPLGRTLLGIDGSGALYRYAPGLAPRDTSAESGGADRPEQSAPRSRRELFWGSDDLYPPATFAPGMRPLAPVPESESRESARWSDALPALAAEVRVPYQFTVAEQERWWQTGDEALAEYRALFTAAPSVTIQRQPATGHNISLSWAARSYHLRALAFAEQCLPRPTSRAGGPPPSSPGGRPGDRSQP